MIGKREIARQSHLRLAEPWQTGTLSGSSEERINVEGTTRREERRVSEQRGCTYTLCQSIDGTGGVIQEGEAYSLNRSEHGILILMGQAPNPRQLIELHIPESNWRRSLNLYEVRWSKPVSVESRGDLYFVGCRLMFGPSRYWAF